MSKKVKTGFLEQDIEWKVSIFTALLVIAIFVTMAIYVYAGGQQNLPTRKFGDVDIRKTLRVGQQTFNKSDVIVLYNGDIIGPVDGSSKIFIIEPIEGLETLVLPSATALEELKNFLDGYTLRFLILNNSKSQSVKITSSDPQVIFLNGNYDSVEASTSSEVIIRKINRGEYQVIMV